MTRELKFERPVGDKPTSSDRRADDTTDTATSRLVDYYDSVQR
jgi:hypothetical protein